MRTLMLLICLGCLAPCLAQVMAPMIGPGGQQGAGRVTLLQPSGAPAAGATVIVRTFTGYSPGPDSNPRMVNEQRFTADAQGQVGLPTAPDEGAPYTPYSSYALVFASNCCVTALPPADFSGVITLLPAKTMEVKITQNEQPVNDATFSMVSIVDIFHFNNPTCGVSTPELIFHSGPDGIARIPVINTGSFENIATTQLKAFATASVGNEQPTVYAAFANSMPVSQNVTTYSIALQPTFAIAGFVTTPDGKSLQGAVVYHAQMPLSPVVTDANGRYLLSGIPKPPRISVERLIIIHPDYANSLVVIPQTQTTPEVTILYPRPAERTGFTRGGR